MLSVVEHKKIEKKEKECPFKDLICGEWCNAYDENSYRNCLLIDRIMGIHDALWEVRKCWDI